MNFLNDDREISTRELVAGSSNGRASEILPRCGWLGRVAVVKNVSTEIVYLGNKNVTTADGFPLAPATSAGAADGGDFPTDSPGSLWAISASGTAKVRVMEQQP